MSRVAVARVLKTRGLAGEVKVETADARKDRFKVGDVLKIESGMTLTVKRYQAQGIYGFLRCDEISSIEAAQPLVGETLYREEEDLPEPEPDSYYVKDLEGLPVITEDGETLGTLEEILETGANDVYRVVDATGHESFIPAVKAFVVGVEPRHRIVVRLIEGMR